MRKPTIHLNGSDPAFLAGNYWVALKKLQEAAELLALCAPHGRDYYIQAVQDCTDPAGEAMREHGLRMRKVGEVIIELSQLHRHCVGELGRLGRKEG